MRTCTRSAGRRRKQVEVGSVLRAVDIIFEFNFRENGGEDNGKERMKEGEGVR